MRPEKGPETDSVPPDARDPDFVAEAFAAMDRRLDAAGTAPVALALSGGGDSMALLHMAAAWTRARGRPLLALTVDHGLNPESAAWTRFAGEAAERAGAAWRPLVWTGLKPTTGLPAAARAARHARLAEAGRTGGASVLLVAHTADDERESARLRLETPSHGRLREWGPSPAWPEGRGVFILRPLLNARRADLRAWLAAQGVRWLEDPANADLRFARARIRARIRAGAEGEGGGGLDDSAPDRPDDDAPEAPPGLAALAQEIEIGADGRMTLPRAALLGHPAAERLLAMALLTAAGGETPPRSAAVRALLQRLRAETSLVATLAGAQARANGDIISIVREAGAYARAPAPLLALRAGETGVWDGRFEIMAAEGGLVRPLAGSAARLHPEDKARLLRVEASARPALPVFWRNELAQDGSGSPRLPQPFGAGPAFARALAGGRLKAACGLVEHERDIAPLWNCEGMAQSAYSSYVEDLALA
jgi:tRNA(Ile)-lysidine synthase